MSNEDRGKVEADILARQIHEAVRVVTEANREKLREAGRKNR